MVLRKKRIEKTHLPKQLETDRRHESIFFVHEEYFALQQSLHYVCKIHNLGDLAPRIGYGANPQLFEH